MVTIGDDTVTGLRELPGYPPPTGARRDRPWKAVIQPGRTRQRLPGLRSLRTRSTETRKSGAGERWLLPFRDLGPS